MSGLDDEENADDNNGEEGFHDTVEDGLSGLENEHILTEHPPKPPSIAAVTSIVNEVRRDNYDNISESPLILAHWKLEDMEQGARFQDIADSYDSLYHSQHSAPPVGVWPSQRPQLQSARYNFIGSFLRSKFCTYCFIITTLIGIGVGVSAAITKGFEHAHHRNEILHPKWENDGVEQVDQQQQLPTEGEDFLLVNIPDNAENEGSIMQQTGVSLPTEIYTDERQDMFYLIEEAYIPIWFDRESGWNGSTHAEAMEFCKSVDDSSLVFVPCPHNVYCPGDQTKLLFNEEMEEADSWAPVLETNKWVQVGSGGRACESVEMYERWSEKLTRHIMCCLEKPLDMSVGSTNNDGGVQVPPNVKDEGGDSNVDDPIPPPPISSSSVSNNNVSGGTVGMNKLSNNSEIPEEHFDFEGSVINELNPVWYGTDEWISGSYEDASHFCNFKSKELCPYAAYCPYGPGNHPIGGWAANKDFEEQWAPIKSKWPKANLWVLIGAQNDNPFSQCNVEDSPSFGFDKSEPELKLHIMCCDKKRSEPISSETSSTAKPVEENIDIAPSDNDPVWYSSNDGWDGGGHETALLYCLSKEKTLCPVETYCPSGPKRPPLPGHGELGLGEDFEQWAPASDKENYWIMVGLYAMDETTQCQDQDEIIGGYPSWGLDETYSEHKRHILCCSST